jgi:hypothetical protein
MNFIVGRLLSVGLSEAEVFWMFTQVVEVYMPPDYYSALLGVQIDVQVFLDLVKVRLPRLAGHLELLGIDVSYYCVQWFVSIFSYSLPKHSVLRIWDVFFVRGCPFIFEVALGLLSSMQTTLLKMHDFSTPYADLALKTVQAFTHELKDSEAVLEAAHAFLWTISPTDVQVLREAKRTLHYEDLKTSLK